ncbi:MAG TPA: hypothetical protein VMF89_21980, partial [Polyangiales bacterium]|nr:hypothetical protein [Polyangiales bacterium]
MLAGLALVAAVGCGGDVARGTPRLNEGGAGGFDSGEAGSGEFAGAAGDSGAPLGPLFPRPVP